MSIPMPSLHPDEAAKQWLCPLARTFGTAKASPNCQGPACALWRWMPMSANDDRFKSAVQREITALQAEKPNVQRQLLVKEATARVSADPDAFTFPNETDRGYCGLGGKPEGVRS